MTELPFTQEDAKEIYWQGIDPPEPLLEYVEQWAEEFCPSYDEGCATDPNTGKNKTVWYRVESRAPGFFVSRLLRNMITDLEHCKRRYTEEAQELHAMLDAFEIDKDKFWYMCLIMKDYIEGFAHGTKPLPSHSKVLGELIDKLDEMEPNEEYNNWVFGFVKHKAKLTLKVEGSKRVFSTDDSTVLNIINYALSKFYHSYCMDDDSIFNSAKIGGKKAKFSTTDKAYLFYKYMKWFLKDKKCKHKTEGSRSKDLLISRTLYIFDIIRVPRERFYEYDGNGNRALRDMIKKWTDPQNKAHNAYYDYI